MDEDVLAGREFEIGEVVSGFSPRSGFGGFGVDRVMPPARVKRVIFHAGGEPPPGWLRQGSDWPGKAGSAIGRMEMRTGPSVSLTGKEMGTWVWSPFVRGRDEWR